MWGYGNQSDLDSLWPTRPSWLKFVVAGYTSEGNINFAKYNAIAWQYTNGSENHTSYPSSSSPFGNCDHNSLRPGNVYPLPQGGGADVTTPDDVWKYNKVPRFNPAEGDISGTPNAVAQNDLAYIAGQVSGLYNGGVATQVRAELSKGTGQGQTSWGGTNQAMYNRTGDIINKLNAQDTKISDIVEQTKAQGVQITDLQDSQTSQSLSMVGINNKLEAQQADLDAIKEALNIPCGEAPAPIAEDVASFQGKETPGPS